MCLECRWTFNIKRIKSENYREKENYWTKKEDGEKNCSNQERELGEKNPPSYKKENLHIFFALTKKNAKTEKREKIIFWRREWQHKNLGELNFSGVNW